MRFRPIVALSSLSLVVLACGDPPAKPAADPSLTEDKPATSAKPTNAAAPADLGKIEAAIGAGDFASAKAAADAAVAKDPKNAKALYYAGVAREGLGDKAGAEKSYRDALAAAPGHPEASTNLGALLLDSDRAPEAVTVLKVAVAKAPDDALLQGNLGAALLATKDPAGAADAFGKAVAKVPDQPTLRLGWASALTASGHKDDAAKALKDGVAKIDDRDTLAAFGRALAQAGAFPDAIAAIDKALTKPAKDVAGAAKGGADLLTYRALFKRSASDVPGAKTDLEAAIKADPNFAPAETYLGEIFESTGKKAEAKKAYETAVKLGADTPSGKRAQEHLAAMKK